MPKVATASCTALHSEISPRCRHPVASCSGSLAFLSGQFHSWPDMVAWGRQSVWDVSTAMVRAIVFTQALQTPVAQPQEQSRASRRLTVSSSSVFTITSLEFFSLCSLTLAKCFLSLSLLLQVVRKIYFGSCDGGVGGQKTRRGRGGKESKQMMAPGWRFPPLRGNSSGLELILSCQPRCWEKCPNRLKQHNRARHRQVILQLQQAAFQHWTGIHTGDQCLSMFAHHMMSCVAFTVSKRVRLLSFHTTGALNMSLFLTRFFQIM